VSERQTIHITANGMPYEREVEPRLLLSDFLWHELGLTGTHVGCEHGVCGACTILFADDPRRQEGGNGEQKSREAGIVEGATMRSCLLFAVQADGHAITTVEGLGGKRICIRCKPRFATRMDFAAFARRDF